MGLTQNTMVVKGWRHILIPPDNIRLLPMPKDGFHHNKSQYCYEYYFRGEKIGGMTEEVYLILEARNQFTLVLLKAIFNKKFYC